MPRHVRYEVACRPRGGSGCERFMLYISIGGHDVGSSFFLAPNGVSFDLVCRVSDSRFDHYHATLNRSLTCDWPDQLVAHFHQAQRTTSSNMAALVWDVFLFIALFGLHFLVLFVKPSPYRSLIFLPICSIVTYLMRSTNTGDSTPLRGSSIASVALPILFSASNFVFLTDAQRVLRRKGQKVPAFKMEWRARLEWAFALFCSPRGIGWEHESRHVIRPLPPSVCASRWSFVKTQVIRLVVHAAVLDLLRWHDRWNPCYAKDGPSITAFGWMWRCFSMFSWSIQTYIQIDRLYWALGLLSVFVGLSTPGEWPYFFGDLWDAYTVRRFWGSVVIFHFRQFPYLTSFAFPAVRGTSCCGA